MGEQLEAAVPKVVTLTFFCVYRRKDKLIEGAGEDNMSDTDCDKQIRLLEEEQVKLK